MPCYDSRNDPSYVRSETIDQCRKDFLHNSPVADMLCNVMRTVSTAQRDLLLAANPKLVHWWSDHRKRDVKVAREKADKVKARKAHLLKEIQKLQAELGST